MNLFISSVERVSSVTAYFNVNIDGKLFPMQIENWSANIQFCMLRGEMGSEGIPRRPSRSGI